MPFPPERAAMREFASGLGMEREKRVISAVSFRQKQPLQNTSEKLARKGRQDPCRSGSPRPAFPSGPEGDKMITIRQEWARDRNRSAPTRFVGGGNTGQAARRPRRCRLALTRQGFPAPRRKAQTQKQERGRACAHLRARARHPRGCHALWRADRAVDGGQRRRRWIIQPGVGGLAAYPGSTPHSGTTPTGLHP